MIKTFFKKRGKRFFESFLYDKYQDVEIEMNVAAGVVLRNDPNNITIDQILLIQRAEDDNWPNYWEIPRGKCDKGKNEDLIKCLKREIKEETGIDIEPIKLIDKFDYVADEGKRKSTQHNYLCKLSNNNQQVKLSKEHQRFRWVSSLSEVQLKQFKK